MTSKDTIDKLNRLQFFYWCKPPKTPEVLEQDKEQVERDFALIRKDLEILEILKPHLKLQNIGTTPKQEIALVMDENMVGYEKLKEWLEKC